MKQALKIVKIGGHILDDSKAKKEFSSNNPVTSHSLEVNKTAPEQYSL